MKLAQASIALLFIISMGCAPQVPSPSRPVTLVTAQSEPKRSLPQRKDAPKIREKLKRMGGGLYVYTAWKDTRGIAEAAREMRCGHVLPRYAGLKRTMTGDRPLTRFADEMAKENLKVMPWIYYYPSTGKQFLEEIYTGIGSKPNFAGVMINIEHRMSDEEIDILCETIDTLRSKYAPDSLLGYTGYNLPITHDYIPILDLLRFTDFWSPQVYWGHNGSSPQKFLGRGYNQWYRVGELLKYDPIIVPVGQTYHSDRTVKKRPKTGEFRGFIKATSGYDIIAWYSYEEVKHLKGAMSEIRLASDEFRPRIANQPEPLIIREGSLGWTILKIIGAFAIFLAAIAFMFYRKRQR